jgi:hypothetical protein
MPSRRLRRHLLDRVLGNLRAASELGLAFLMTAGVASCGGEELGGGKGADAETDGNNDDHHAVMEGLPFEGGVTEAAMVDGGPDGCFCEDGGLEAGDDGPVVTEAAIDASKH